MGLIGAQICSQFVCFFKLAVFRNKWLGFAGEKNILKNRIFACVFFSVRGKIEYLPVMDQSWCHRLQHDHVVAAAHVQEKTVVGVTPNRFPLQV